MGEALTLEISKQKHSFKGQIQANLFFLCFLSVIPSLRLAQGEEE